MRKRTQRRWVRLFVAKQSANPTQYASLLQEARRGLRVSQEVIGGLVLLARPTISKIETRRRACRLPTATRLSAAFGCDTDVLFSRRGPLPDDDDGPQGLQPIPNATTIKGQWNPISPNGQSILGFWMQVFQNDTPFSSAGTLGLITLALAQGATEYQGTSPFLDVYFWAQKQDESLLRTLGCLQLPAPIYMWQILKRLDEGHLRAVLQKWGAKYADARKPLCTLVESLHTALDEPLPPTAIPRLIIEMATFAQEATIATTSRSALEPSFVLKILLSDLSTLKL